MYDDHSSTAPLSMRGNVPVFDDTGCLLWYNGSNDCFGYVRERNDQRISVGGFSRPIPQRLKGITVFAAGAKCPGGILLEKGRAMGNTVAVEVANMLAAAWLMLSSLFYSLQLSSGSFPRPLTEEEERYYLDLAGKGDLEARNVLIERNLRLVAHIMKN